MSQAGDRILLGRYSGLKVLHVTAEEIPFPRAEYHPCADAQRLGIVGLGIVGHNHPVLPSNMMPLIYDYTYTIMLFWRMLSQDKLIRSINIGADKHLIFKAQTTHLKRNMRRKAYSM